MYSLEMRSRTRKDGSQQLGSKLTFFFSVFEPAENRDPLKKRKNHVPNKKNKKVEAWLDRHLKDHDG